MAAVRRYGRPSLFITMTCNDNWKEIREALESDEIAEDRPDIIDRVFRLKLKELMNDLIKKKVFGETLSHVYVIEFQKRGRPHAHILIILKNKLKGLYYILIIWFIFIIFILL